MKLDNLWTGLKKMEKKESKFVTFGSLKLPQKTWVNGEALAYSQL